MKHLGTVEMAKKKMAMRVRATLRLAAQEQYADAINDILPEAEAVFDKKLQLGKLPKPIDVARILDA